MDGIKEINLTNAMAAKIPVEIVIELTGKAIELNDRARNPSEDEKESIQAEIRLRQLNIFN